jgi:hypothetical protein
MLQPMHCVDAEQLLAAVDAHVAEYIGEVPASDDVTMLAVARCE